MTFTYQIGSSTLTLIRTGLWDGLGPLAAMNILEITHNTVICTAVHTMPFVVSSVPVALHHCVTVSAAIAIVNRIARRSIGRRTKRISLNQIGKTGA